MLWWYMPDSRKQAGICICLEDESFILSICIYSKTHCMIARGFMEQAKHGNTVRQLLTCKLKAKQTPDMLMRDLSANFLP